MWARATEELAAIDQAAPAAAGSRGREHAKLAAASGARLRRRDDRGTADRRVGCGSRALADPPPRVRHGACVRRLSPRRRAVPPGQRHASCRQGGVLGDVPATSKVVCGAFVEL